MEFLNHSVCLRLCTCFLLFSFPCYAYLHTYTSYDGKHLW